MLNKIDLGPPEGFALADDRILGLFEVSAATGEGIEEFERGLLRLCPPAPEPAEAAGSGLPDFLVYRPRPRGRYRILRTESGYRVVGPPPGEKELAEALRAAGARPGAEVAIGDEVVELT